MPPLQVLRLFNWYGSSRLPLAQQKSISVLLSLPNSDPGKIAITTDLILQARASLNPEVKAELLVYSGVLAHQIDRVSEAESLLAEAVKLFERGDTHRLAIAEWLLFLICYEKQNQAIPTEWAKKTWKHLNKQVQYAAQLKDKDTGGWYQHRIYELVSDIFQSPRYVYEFMFDIRGSQLSVASANIKGKVEAFLNEGRLFEACHMMKQLEKVGLLETDRDEKGEVLAYIGMANAEMHDYGEARGYYRRAIAYYLPYSHENSMVRWMHSLSLLNDRNLECEAVAEMQKCLDQVNNFAIQADQKDKLTQKDWYRSVAEGMKIILRASVDRIS